MHDMEIKSKYLGFVRYLHVQLLNSNIHCTPVFIHLNEGKVYGLLFCFTTAWGYISADHGQMRGV